MVNSIFNNSVGDDPNGSVDLTAAAFGAGFSRFSDGISGPVVKSEVTSAPIPGQT